MPEQIAILGTGNVAHHLTRGFNLIGQPIKYLIARNRKKGLALIEEVSPTTILLQDNTLQPYDCSFLIVCVQDSQLQEIAKTMSIPENCIIVHTSGGIGMNVFKDNFRNYGVLYPFQTFSKKRALNIHEIPFFIEGSNPNTFNRILTVANTLTQKVKALDSQLRANLHLTGVIVNNFTNYLINQAFRLVEKNGLEKDDLIPLINETIAKLSILKMEDSQTGPAVRGDHAVIEKHLNMLNDDPKLKELYSLFTAHIQSQKT
ncbi:MAG: DUF2520 domain-containing protein [Cyclobacteriaceae bacterium]